MMQNNLAQPKLLMYRRSRFSGGYPPDLKTLVALSPVVDVGLLVHRGRL